MYIMCVILCLFSTLSRRVGALQISILLLLLLLLLLNIIIIVVVVVGGGGGGGGGVDCMPQWPSAKDV